MKARNISRRWLKIALPLLAVPFIFAGLGSAQANKASTTRNLVYFEDLGDDVVHGFVNDGQGNLTSIGFFNAEGFGVCCLPEGAAAYQADGEVLISPDGNFLYCVAGHTDQISYFTIDPSGTLTFQGIVDSHGQDPAALAWKDGALSGGTPDLVVVNKNSDPNQFGGVPNYSSFSVDLTNGAPTFLGSVNVAQGSSPSQAVAFPSLDGFLAVNYFSDEVATYRIGQSGGLKQISASTPPGSSPEVLGAAIHPTKAGLYVGLPLQNQVAVYTFDAAGSLIYSTEISNPGGGVEWLAMKASGTRLYTSEPDSGTVSVYNTSAPGKPFLLQHITPKRVQGLGSIPANLAFDPTGQFLYLLDLTSGGGLHVFHVAADGGLTEPKPPIPLHLSQTPGGLATVMK